MSPVVKPESNPLKGAIVSIGSGEPAVIRFQYNPTELSRSIAPAFYSGGSSRVEPARFAGAAVETIDLEAKFEATDGLAAGDPNTLKDGVRPRLAILELLAYPSLEQVDKEAKLLEAGTVGSVAWPATTTLLMFGMNRIVPVRIKSLSITEEAFDSSLTPIQATAKLSFEVVSYSQATAGSELYSAHKAYQKVLERAAKRFLAQAADGSKYASAAQFRLR
jgi:hypothetical protein